MDTEEKKQLISLLQKLKKADLVPPHMPYEIWLELSTLFPLPAVEVIITRNGKDFLLTERRDEHWNGWHIPGGFMAYQESFEEACKRVALRELNMDIEFKKMFDAFVWKEHPYGAPISIICICTPKGEPSEGTYFSEIPKDMVPNHTEFLQKFLKEYNP